ncbi:MAG: hypothetical protein KFH98_04465 [Gemmatimonadetes bacterium]|nr:hypothetical protein [Gemmatimonadota bacterium]
MADQKKAKVGNEDASRIDDSVSPKRGGGEAPKVANGKSSKGGHDESPEGGTGKPPKGRVARAIADEPTVSKGYESAQEPESQGDGDPGNEDPASKSDAGAAEA